MAISFSSTKVARFAGALYGVALNSNTYNSAMQEIALRGFDAVANDVYNADFGSQPTSVVASTMVANLGLTGQAAVDGAAYITAQLNGAAAAGRGAVVSSILSTFAGLASDPSYGTFVNAFNGRVDNALLYSQGTNNYHSPFGGMASGTQFNLTTGFDNITGTAGDDVFTANSLGGVNTLNDGDIINGGAGNDTLNADLISTGHTITPKTSSIETVNFRVQNNSTDMASNNTQGQGTTVDAERMADVTTWSSTNSRADLIIEDVRIDSNKSTIAFVQSDPGNVDLGVYFNERNLVNTTSGTSILNLYLMDTAAAATPATADQPLLNQNFSSLTFFVGSQVVKLTSDAINAATTYAQLKDAFVSALRTATIDGQAQDLSSMITVAAVPTGNMTTSALQDGIVPQVANGFQNLAGSIIRLSVDSSLTISKTDPTPQGRSSGWGYPVGGNAPIDGVIAQAFSSGNTASTGLVSTKVILDDVGMGDTGGDLVIGGMSTGLTSNDKGVELFNIEVRDNSKLQTINSTNNTLREVYITNGKTTSSSSAYVTTVTDAGKLTVNGTNFGGSNAISVVDANLEGTNAIAGTNQTVNHSGQGAAGFTDVRVIDASAMRGDFAFTAAITKDSIAKYVNLVDTQVNPGADVATNNTNTLGANFVYTGGAGNDAMNIVIDQAVVGATDTLSGREDFTFNIDGGAGNDNISVRIGGNQTAAWYADQKQNANVTIKGGAGDDVIRTIGAGDFIVNAGDGNDTVYIDNSGTIGAKWAVGAANAVLPDLQTAGLNTGFLWKGKLTVALVGPNAAASVTSTAGADSVAANFDNGFEAVVDIPTGANSTVTQLYINQAIKTAINKDPVLSKLLLAVDGPASTLVINSLIDGAFNANDLRITVSSTDLTTLSVTDQNAALTAYKSYAHNSQATVAMAQTANAAAVTATNGMNGMDTNQSLAANGTDSAARSDSTIDLGTGNDVVVLGTGANSHDTLVFNGYDQGNKTVVNFSDVASAAGNNGDNLNFSSYLTGQFRAAGSGSQESQNLIPYTVNADNIVEANSVTQLSGLSFNTTTATFANLNAANLKAAINSTNIGLSNYGGITAATLDAANAYTDGVGASLVGGIGKAVVMVENNLNRGEYKVFELTFSGLSTNATRDFTDVKMIADVDFGHQINLSTNMIQNSAANLSGLGGGGGGGGVVPPGGAVAQNVNVAGAGTVNETAATNTTFTVAAGSTYTYNIAGFGAGDKLVFPTAGLATINNTNFTDGIVDVQYADGGNTVTVHLTGIPAATDGTIFGASSFNTAFGAGSLN